MWGIFLRISQKCKLIYTTIKGEGRAWILKRLCIEYHIIMDNFDELDQVQANSKNKVYLNIHIYQNWSK